MFFLKFYFIHFILETTQFDKKNSFVLPEIK